MCFYHKQFFKNSPIEESNKKMEAWLTRYQSKTTFMCSINHFYNLLTENIAVPILSLLEFFLELRKLLPKWCFSEKSVKTWWNSLTFSSLVLHSYFYSYNIVKLVFVRPFCFETKAELPVRFSFGRQTESSCKSCISINFRTFQFRKKCLISVTKNTRNDFQAVWLAPVTFSIV